MPFQGAKKNEDRVPFSEQIFKKDLLHDKRIVYDSDNPHFMQTLRALQGIDFI
jgi:hypothetical protein